jgi:hypothetical protein
MGNSEQDNVLHFEDPQQRVFTHSDGLETPVNAGLINIGHICYTNVYLQEITSCPTLPPCLNNLIPIRVWAGTKKLAIILFR